MRKIYLIYGLLILINLMWSYHFAIRLWWHTNALKLQQSHLLSQLKLQIQRKKQMQFMQQQVQLAQKTLPLKHIVSPPTVMTLFEKMQQLAHQNQLQLIYLKPAQVQKNTTQYTQHLQLEIRGHYLALTNFIWAITQFSYLMQITQLEIKKISEHTESLNLDIAIEYEK